MSINIPEVDTALNDMWSAAKKAAEKIHTSDKKVNQLQSQFDFLENTINIKNNEIVALKKSIDDMSRTINEKNERITTQFVEIDNLMKQQEKYSDLETSYFTLVNQNQGLKSDLESYAMCKNELDKLRAEHTALTAQLDDATDELASCKSKLVAAQRDVNDFEFAKKELTNSKHDIISRNDQITALRVQVAELQSININNVEHSKQLQTQLDTITEQNAILTAQAAEQAEAVDTATSEYEMDKLKLQAIIANLQMEMRDGYYQKQYIQNQNNELNEAIESIKKDYEEQLLASNQLCSTIADNYKESSQKYIDDLEDMQEYANKFSDDYKKMTDITHSLMAEKEHYDNHIKELRGEIERLNGLNEGLEQKVETLSVERYSVDLYDDGNDFHSNNDASELLQENERLLELVTELNDRITASSTNYTELVAENERLEEEIGVLNNDVAKVQKLYKGFDKLKEQSAEQADTIKNLQAEINEYKKRIYEEDSLFATENIKAVQAINNSVRMVESVEKKVSNENEVLVHKLESFLSKLEEKL
ncbi:MAG: hypothetical protein LBO69_06110 [Ignavibacteria bacterium]|jgi:chromosome segregation ATPase|nr:hypothetical protein [Ignavibacteria bacterium]